MNKKLEQLKARLQGDPTPEPAQTLRITEEKLTEVTVSELREAFEANPSHPISAVYRNAVIGQQEEQKVAVSTVDLLGVIENREVLITHDLEMAPDGTQVRTTRKNLGESLASKLQKKAPAPPAVAQ